jgi:hypothetical protein
MTIATMNDALPLFGFMALALVGCGGPVLWAIWTVRGRRWAWQSAAVITAGIVIAIIASGEPLLLGVVAIMVGGAVLARREFQPTAQKVAAVFIVGAGLPLYGLTLVIGLIAWATVGCAPDAYECPF